MNSIERANKYLNWLMRTPTISRDNPQEVELAKAFDECAEEAIKTHEHKRWEECYRRVSDGS